MAFRRFKENVLFVLTFPSPALCAEELLTVFVCLLVCAGQELDCEEEL